MKKGAIILFSLSLFLGTSYGFWFKKNQDKKDQAKPKAGVESSIETETSTTLGTETLPIFQTTIKEPEPLPSLEKKKEGDVPPYPKGRTDKKERACTKETSRPKTFVPDKDPPKPIYPKK